ncbi:hypothetical protein [Grimontia celer]|uniref:hypothetical protein n=1 Tax=Grimontia celer TaxID=1796497 RepID=UPI0012F8BE8E|nr:hypothetical protein [Grimontia celer]
MKKRRFSPSGLRILRCRAMKSRRNFEIFQRCFRNPQNTLLTHLFTAFFNALMMRFSRFDSVGVSLLGAALRVDEAHYREVSNSGKGFFEVFCEKVFI